MEHNEMFKDGNFVIGCNYWAAHAGTGMWSDWRADVVEQDFKRLSEEGLQVLRVFPLWPDFQPLTLLLGFNGNPVEYRHGEKPLADDEAGAAGVSTVAMDHFRELADLAQKYGLKLIIGLVTGWMSGRCFVPPAFERKNILTDPAAIMWQVRFVKYFVKHFKDHPAIASWDLGNECNCIALVPDRASAWLWTSAIVHAIKSVDAERPIISGMHSLSPAGEWTMQDQGELTDILTTHPYPLFTPHCSQDPANTIRTLLHATSESLFYSGIGGKPCLVEEIGTLGPMNTNEELAADFVRTNLFSNWANGMNGLLWWCANEQSKLVHAPYDWLSVERELGLLRTDGTAKPVLKEMGKFGAFLKELPFARLPDRILEAVCVLSKEQDQWGAAYSSFILAKQAGFDMEFRYESQPLPDAALYLLPCITDLKVISRRRYMELMEKVAAGASLYISFNGGFLSHFEEMTGLRVTTRERRYKNLFMSLLTGEEKVSLDMNDGFRLTLEPVRAEVLGMEADGNPIFTCAPYGKGKVYFLGFPLEIMLAQRTGVFHDRDAQAYWKIYECFSRKATAGRAVKKLDPMIGITEHPAADGSRVVIMVNYSPEPRKVNIALAEGWKAELIIYGDALTGANGGYEASINKNDAMVITIVKNSR